MDRDETRGPILVPPSRAEGNVLAAMLRRAGLEVVEFPELAPGLPTNFDALDAAAREAERFDWIFFSGSRSAAHFFARWRALGHEPADFPARIATLGGGARAEVRALGLAPEYHPRRHVAEDVAAGWPAPANQRVLLVRAEGATGDLPRALAARRARVVSVAGYRMECRADPAVLEDPGSIGVVALANGTAARYLTEGLAAIGRTPAEVRARVATVGEATAETARAAGFTVTDVAGGHVFDLVALVRRIARS